MLIFPTIKKAVGHSLSVFWLVILVLQLLIWANMRDIFFAQRPLVETVASFLRDLLWLPIALTLPLYLMALFAKTKAAKYLKIIAATLLLLALGAGISNLQSYFRHLFFLTIPFFTLIIYQAYQKRKISANALLYSAVLLALVVNYRGRMLPSNGVYHRPGKGKLSVMTFNIHVNPSKEKRALALETIQREMPDVVFIQEINSHDRKLFNGKLGELYPYQLWSDRFETYLGGVILSRFPFVTSGNVDIQTQHASGHTNLNHAVIRFAGKDIHLLNCHLFPSGHEFIQVLLGRIGMNAFIDDARKVYMRRLDEAEQIYARTAALNGPVILAGDFNDTPNSQVYRYFSKRLQNAHDQAGWGLGTTFGKDFLLWGLPHRLAFLALDFLCIDHVFCSNDFRVLSSAILPVEASDHKAQVVELELKR